MIEENVPVPVPSVVFVDKLMVGFCSLLHTTPRAVTSAPPSFVTVPPDTAELLVMEVTEVVDRMGATALVLNTTELPYATPAELTA